jgi:hypothetical protein
MSIIINDEVQLSRYRKLSPTKRGKVDATVIRYLKACAAVGVEPNIKVAFREAIDLVVTGRWEADRPWDRPETHCRYGIYTAPIKDGIA